MSDRHRRHAYPTTTAAALALYSALAGTSAHSADSPAAPMAARDAGVRYGQALGAIEICHGARLTDKAKTLAAAYQGSAQDAFKAEAAKTLEAWMKVKACANQFDPNQCKIIMDKSCLAAEAEVGERGTILPGLVEFKERPSELRTPTARPPIATP